jgi:transglutaminase-like putative cysteine protease
MGAIGGWPDRARRAARSRSGRHLRAPSLGQDGRLPAGLPAPAPDAVLGPPPLTTPAWERVREAAFTTSDIGPLSPAHFLLPSCIVSLDPEIRDYTRESFSPYRPVLDASIELMNRLKSGIVYEIGANTATPMSFALRRGVCQDFAHIMISGLRGIGLPAGYVSGYLRTAARPDAMRLQGADAMHAWVLVWCGTQVGWIGLDPTNGILVSDEHSCWRLGATIPTLRRWTA